MMKIVEEQARNADAFDSYALQIMRLTGTSLIEARANLRTICTRSPAPFWVVAEYVIARLKRGMPVDWSGTRDD